MNAQALHHQMVERLVAGKAIRDSRVEAAFRAVSRHPFLPGVALETVYSGEAVVTHRGLDGFPVSSSSEPAIMAPMLEQLDLALGHRVLEIGAGTGYNAALLAHLVRPGGGVVSIDIDAEIAREAEAHLADVGIQNVRVVAGDGWLGAPAEAPFHRIESTASIWDIAPAWSEQLTPDGMLVAPFRFGVGTQASIAFKRHGDRFRSMSLVAAGFMGLRGDHGGASLIRAGDWILSVEGLAPAAASTLVACATSEPRSLPCPTLPNKWFLRVELEEPHAVWMRHAQDWYRQRLGIFDAADASLAVVEAHFRSTDDPRLLAFGGEAAAGRLQGVLATSRPLVWAALRVDAIPAASAQRDAAALTRGATWVLRRPHHWFVLTEGTSAGSLPCPR